VAVDEVRLEEATAIALPRELGLAQEVVVDPVDLVLEALTSVLLFLLWK